jgi:hypothetical protein
MAHTDSLLLSFIEIKNLSLRPGYPSPELGEVGDEGYSP